jgi:hypothetical protein
VIPLLFLLSCGNKTEQIKAVNCDSLQLRYDTLSYQLAWLLDSVISGNDSINYRLINIVDSVIGENNSLKVELKNTTRELFIKKYTIERAKYRLDICNKNPSQVKFLRSWLNRIFYEQ